MKFNQEKKIQLGTKIIDFANLIFAGWVLGQAFLDRPFDPFFAIVGGFLFISLWLLALWIMREGR